MGLMAASSLLLTACGQSENLPANSGEDTDTDTSEGDVQLRFTWWGADARAQLTEEVIEMFEAENPGITVTTEWSVWDGYWDKLATSAAASDMPDVFQMDEQQIASYGTQGSLPDLESQPEVLDVSTIAPEVLLTGEVDGTIVGAPVGVGICSVAANPELLERAGVEFRTTPRGRGTSSSRPPPRSAPSWATRASRGSTTSACAPPSWPPTPVSTGRPSSPRRATSR